MPLLPTTDYKYIYMFYGSGLSRIENITAGFDSNSRLTTISEFSIDWYACEIVDKGDGPSLEMGDYVGLFDKMVDGRLTYRGN